MLLSLPAGAQAKDVAPSGPGDDCTRCHDAWQGAPVVHAPIALGLCAACHASTSATEHTFATPTDTAASCRLCHAAPAAGVATHAPTREGLCLTCHAPHASKFAALLRASDEDTCRGCHLNASAGRHVVAGFVYGDWHPVRGRPDPRARGGALTCSSCHAPHAAPTRQLYRFEVKGKEALCRTCHPM
ncbi:MAG: cytochrome c3 family protein [Myxococcota bacterium]